MKIVIHPNEFLQHEYYYRRMMQIHPDKFTIVADVEEEWHGKDILPAFEECRYIGIEQASEILDKSKGTIVKYIKNGLLRGIKTYKWAVREDDVLNFEEKKRKTPRKTNQTQRTLALERDDYKCCHCGSTENLEVHHIKHRSDGGTDELDNLITLCAECHMKEHEGEPVHFLMQSRLNDR